LLGKKFNLSLQLKNGFSGSNLYHIIRIETNSSQYSDLFSESRCNFEKYPNGLLLWINKRQKIINIAVSYKEIQEIKLTEGKIITSVRNNLLTFLLRLFRIPIHKLKFIPFWFLYYKSKEAFLLDFKTNDFYIQLKSNGFNFKEEKKYFNDF
jgi:hypothetical protein